MHKDTNRVVAVLLMGASVVVRSWQETEIYLYKNILDHFINVLSGHGLGVLCYLDNILAKSLDIECQHVL